MPLYEYECRQCGHRFEVLVSGSREPECPECRSKNLEKLLSAFGVGSGSGQSSRSTRAGGGCSPSFSGG